jgi:hypothetical protein
MREELVLIAAIHNTTGSMLAQYLTDEILAQYGERRAQQLYETYRTTEAHYRKHKVTSQRRNRNKLTHYWEHT